MKIKKWIKKRWLIVTIIFLSIILVPYILSRVLSPWHIISGYSITQTDKTIDPEKASIRVACYNIAHGRGVAESNTDGGNQKERLDRLNKIAQKLNSVDADIVVLNEVDFNTSWSYSINQAKYLAQNSGYSYWLEQRNLDFRILTWTWKFGNAVLSKYPISEEEVLNYPGYSSLETILAGKKRGISCLVTLGKKKVKIIAAHLSHRSEDIRVKSAELITEITSKSDVPTILIGDLNSTPTGFPKSVKDKNGENAIDHLDQSRVFQRFPDQSMISEENFTYNSIKPVSVIDWIFIPKNWKFLKYKVEDSKLSDHRLIYADIMYKEPNN